MSTQPIDVAESAIGARSEDKLVCPVCSDTRFEVLLESLSPGEVPEVIRCQSCDLVTVRPLPTAEALQALYNDFYAEGSKSFDAGKLGLARRSMAGYCAHLKGLGIATSEARFIDVGGALGYYTRAAAEYGMRVTLIEHDPKAAEFARETNLVPDVYCGSLREFRSDRPGAKADIVFLRHVIEHVPNVRAFLSEVVDLVADGGVLILETDNNSGIEIFLKPGTYAWYLDLYRSKYRHVSLLRLLRTRPLAIDPPRHVFAFRLHQLRGLLETRGMVIDDIFSYRLGDSIYWPNLPDGSLLNVVGHLVRLRPRAAVLELADVLLIPIRRILPSLGLASGICVYARKVPSSTQTPAATQRRDWTTQDFRTLD